jgi:hypothetical protein
VLVNDCANEWLCLALRTNSKGTTVTEIRTPDDGSKEVPKLKLLCLHFSTCTVALKS